MKDRGTRRRPCYSRGPVHSYRDAVKVIQGYVKRHGFKIAKGKESGIMYEPGCKRVLLFKKNLKGGTRTDVDISPIYADLDECAGVIIED